MMMDSPMVVDLSVSSDVSQPRNARCEPSGNDKRRERHQLPQVALLCSCDMGKRVLCGAVLMVYLVEVSSSNNVYVVLGGVCGLKESRDVSIEDWHIAGKKQETPVESSVRRSQAAAGGSLNDHFNHWACNSWKVWEVDKLIAERLLSDDPPPYVQVERGLARRLHVKIQRICDSSEVVHNLDKDFEANAFDDQFEGVPACSHSESPPCTGIGTSSVASQALARLDTLSTTRSVGTGTHRCKPEVIMQALELKAALRPQVSWASLHLNGPVSV